MKVLFVATVEIHILTFHLPYLRCFAEHGYEVHVACAGDGPIPGCHKRHSVPFERSPFKIGNLRALRALRALMDEHRYDLIHCHTPVGGVIGRLAAARIRKRYGAKVFYTAHGFQFYRGGPLKDWLLYYPVEQYMARFTDVLITINQEDYDTALRKKFKAGAAERINGIGLDIGRFQTNLSDGEIAALKQSVGVGEQDFVLLCVGELNHNKNQLFLMTVLKALREKGIAGIKLLLAGPDSLNGSLQKKAEALGLAEDVVFLGFRADIPAMLAMADIAVSASRREGLPFNVLEAMAAGKSVVVTDNRGHREMVRHGVNGLLVPPDDVLAFTNAVRTLYENPPLRRAFGEVAACTSQKFSLETVMARMRAIYAAAGIKTGSGRV